MEASYVSGQTIIEPTTNSRNFYLFQYDTGGFKFPGNIDEFTIRNSVETSDWISTKFNNQDSPSTFWTEGVEPPPSTVEAPSMLLEFI